MFFSNQYKKAAASLTELSIYIVVLAILSCCALVSRTLITQAHINKTYEEFVTIRDGYTIFYDQHGCLPGDCMNQSTYSQISDISASLAAVSAGCIATTFPAPAGSSTTPSFATNLIENAAKRTCLFASLRAFGYLSQVNPAIATLNASVAGTNIPYLWSGGNKQAAWDIRTVTSTSAQSTITATGVTNASGLRNAVLSSSISGGLTMPYAIGAATGSLESWAGQTMMLLRDANTATTGGDIVYGGSATYAVSSLYSLKMDKKFDDGLPFSGMIAAGRNDTDGKSASLSAPLPCHTLSGAEYNPNGINANIVSGTSGVTYNTTTNVNKGCLLAFLIPSPMD